MIILFAQLKIGNYKLGNLYKNMYIYKQKININYK